MNISECSKQIQILTKAHANNHMTLDNYLQERKALFDVLDLNVNGINAKQDKIVEMAVAELDEPTEPHELNEPNEPQDKTQPYFAKKIDRCMSFIKGTNS